MDGAPKTNFEVVDFSRLVSNTFNGITGWIGVTQWGEPNKPTLVGSWAEYRIKFGGLLDDSNFPLYCKLALDLGAKLKISRVQHYTDITTVGTDVGVKATVTLSSGGSTAVCTAKSYGTWGNTLRVTVTAAASGAAGKVDIKESVTGFTDLDKTHRDVTAAITADEKALLNQKLRFFQLGTVVVAIPVDDELLVGGTTTPAAEVAALTNADYIGNSVTASGIRAFDESIDVKKICIPEKAETAIDDALYAYVESRDDMMALLRTPIGLDGDTCEDYRMRTGAYAGTPVDTWKAGLFTGGWRVAHPVTGVEMEVPEVVPLAAVFSQRGINNPDWFSFAGPKRGRVRGGLGVVYNFASPARATEWDNISRKGINAFVDDPDYGPMFYDNNTLLRDNTMLKKFEVAELILFIIAFTKPAIKAEGFDPSDMTTWGNIYRSVKRNMDYVKQNRGVWDYLYEGDQDATKIADLVVNTPDNIDTGTYNFNLWIKPKVAMKWVGVRIGVTNSGADFSLLSGQPN